MSGVQLVDPSCREARTTIALMAVILLSSGRYSYRRNHFDDEKDVAIAEAQSLYDGTVRRVVQRHKKAKGKGKGSYPL